MKDADIALAVLLSILLAGAVVFGFDVFVNKFNSSIAEHVERVK